MSLSIAAKEFVPTKSVEDDVKNSHKPLKSSMSVDVPEFVPKTAEHSPKENASKTVLKKQLSKKQSKSSKNITKEHAATKKDDSGDFNPRHDLNWAQMDNVSEEYNARHDKGWFRRAQTESKQKDNLKKSDSYSVNGRREIIHKEQLVQTFSMGFPGQHKGKLQSTKLGKLENKELENRSIKSWSAIVKTAPQRQAKPELDRRSSLKPNTGHSRDLRTMSYDVERDKRTKLSKIKKTSSLLGYSPNSSPKSLKKRLSHQTLTESKSLGPYDFNLSEAKPRLNIKRKSLVLKAKRSAGLRQDPQMDNWYLKDVPAKIELFSTLTKSPDEDDPPPQLIAKPTEKRKLTRTSKNVFSPISNITNLTDKIISKQETTDDYFSNERYQSNNAPKSLDREFTTDSLDKRKVAFAEKQEDDSRKTVLPSNDIPSGPISYSSMLKKSAPVIPIKLKLEETEELIEEKVLTSEEIRLMKKSKKKEKKKMKKQRKIEESKHQDQDADQNQTVAEGDKPKPEKQSKKNMTLDISEMFDKLMLAPSGRKAKKLSQGKQGKQKRVLISTGVVSVVSGLAKKNKTDGKKTARNKYGGTGIIMDGATPIIKRGKERETPKRKKPTLLKKIIKAERERKRLLTEKAVAITVKTDDTQEEENRLQDGSEEKINNQITEEAKKMEAKTTAAVKEPATQEREEKTEVKETLVEQPPVSCSPLSKLPEEIWKQLHSRKFREYCDHVLSKEINNLTHQLLLTLQKYQDRVYHENPTKFKQKRRFVLGLREVLKHMKLKKIKAVVIAPNMERISSEGGLDDYLRSILLLCDQLEIPKIFAMSRHGLGKTLKKKAPVSVVGLFNYDGAQDNFKELMEHVNEARKSYFERMQSLTKDSKKVDVSINSSPLVIEHALRPTTTDSEAELLRQCSQVELRKQESEAELLKQRIITNLRHEEQEGET